MLSFPMVLAYNMQDKKVGCALVQAAMGATLYGGDLTFHFDTKLWELNPSKCKNYKVESEEEFEQIKLITKQAHEKRNEKIKG